MAWLPVFSVEFRLQVSSKVLDSARFHISNLARFPSPVVERVVVQYEALLDTEDVASMDWSSMQTDLLTLSRDGRIPNFILEIRSWSEHIFRWLLRQRLGITASPFRQLCDNIEVRTVFVHDHGVELSMQSILPSYPEKDVDSEAAEDVKASKQFDIWLKRSKEGTASGNE